MSNDADARFNKAVNIIQGLPRDGKLQPTYEDKLSLYGLFKQEGNVRASRPGIFDVLGRAKWDAWARRRDMTTNAAKDAYTDTFLQILSRFADSPLAQNYLDELADISRSESESSEEENPAQEHYGQIQSRFGVTGQGSMRSDSEETDEIHPLPDKVFSRKTMRKALESQHGGRRPSHRLTATPKIMQKGPQSKTIERNQSIVQRSDKKSELSESIQEEDMSEGPSGAAKSTAGMRASLLKRNQLKPQSGRIFRKNGTVSDDNISVENLQKNLQEISARLKVVETNGRGTNSPGYRRLVEPMKEIGSGLKDLALQALAILQGRHTGFQWIAEIIKLCKSISALLRTLLHSTISNIAQMFVLYGVYRTYLALRAGTPLRDVPMVWRQVLSNSLEQAARSIAAKP